ncbi:MAG: PAS domain-containing protein [Salinibacter sp.]
MPDQDSPKEEPDNRSILDPADADAQDAPVADDETTNRSPESSSPSVDDDTPPDAAPDESMEVESLHFEDEDLGVKLRHADEEQLDNAPFGIIKVDDEGTVEFFNQYESDLSGMDPDEVTGRNFFTQVAPCTNNRLFRGRFKKGVRRGELDETFTYTYTYKMRPTLVDVHMFRDEVGHNWITVQKY